MKRSGLRIILLCLLLTTVLASTTLAGDNYHLLNQGNIARDLGNLEEAVEKYENYIDFHPFSTATGGNGQLIKNRQYYLRNLLIAYSNLFNILRKNGQATEIELRLRQLQATSENIWFGAKNRYRLAHIMEENNRIENATELYQKILRTQQENYSSSDIKVSLRAFSRLMTIFSERGDDEKQAAICNIVSRSFQQDFDAKDTYKLATTYLKYGPTRQQGELLLEQLFAAERENLSAENISTLVKTTGQLLRLKSSRQDHAGVTTLIAQSRELASGDISLPNLHKLAVLYLKFGQKEMGKSILAEISRQTNSQWARKALFILGRTAMVEKNWDAAIDHYANYIERYPEERFFSLKAYSKLLDAYWARDGDLAEQEILTANFADIINQVSDYETQLNLARDLYHKGFDQLASSTFHLGRSAALKIAREAPESAESLRAYWQITKYASELEHYDIARESGLTMLNLGKKTSLRHSNTSNLDATDYYRSQTYLWLAKGYAHDEKLDQAKNLLSHFIKEFPAADDADYARVELGHLYEKTGEPNKARSLYAQIKSQRWRTRALAKSEEMNGL